MSLGKLPSLKSLVSGAHPKRRQRPDLTVEMIGSPLDDFRHTMHVGRGGEAFGDTSFLSDYGGSENPSPEKGGGFFARTLRHVRRSPHRVRGGSVKSELAPTTHPPPPISPIIKNAVSLPHLNEIANGGAERFTYRSAPFSTTSEKMYPYGLESGFCTIPRQARQERNAEPSYQAEEPESDTDNDSESEDTEECDTLQSFQLDFGPSFMSEVLGGFGLSASIAEEDEEEEDSLDNSLRDVMTNGHCVQSPEDQKERCAEDAPTYQSHWDNTLPSEETGDFRLNGLDNRRAPKEVLQAAVNNGRTCLSKPTPSPCGQRIFWQNERGGQSKVRRQAGSITKDYKAKTTLGAQVLPSSDAVMRPRDFSKGAQVSAQHYGEATPMVCDQEGGEEESDVSAEEEEPEPGTQHSAGPHSSRVYLALQGGSFTYSAEDEDDDEVKV